METAVWALAFTLLPWAESRKAAAWACLQAGEAPPLGPGEAEELEALRRRLPALREEASRKGARLALPGDPGADRLLAPLPYPVALWVRGTLPPGGPSLAMVGSREGTRPALERAFSWARSLTAAGVAVLSGLARGIDGAAQSLPAASASAEGSGVAQPSGFYLRAWQSQDLAPQYTFGTLPQATIANGIFINGLVAIPMIYPGPIYVALQSRPISVAGINAIVADDHGYFWMDSGRGIYRVARRSLNDFADGRIPAVQCEGFEVVGLAHGRLLEIRMEGRAIGLGSSLSTI